MTHWNESNKNGLAFQPYMAEGRKNDYKSQENHKNIIIISKLKQNISILYTCLLENKLS